jgi:hypothetical protein
MREFRMLDDIDNKNNVWVTGDIAFTDENWKILKDDTEIL